MNVLAERNVREVLYVDVGLVDDLGELLAVDLSVSAIVISSLDVYR